MKILHITPHLGGGVGTVVRGYLEFALNISNEKHKLIALDRIDTQSKNFLNDIQCPWVDKIYSNLEEIDRQITESDLILIHWWNHPLLQDILMNHKLPPARILLWAHISGYPSPNNFTNYIVNYPDKLIFTTPLSFTCPEIQSLSKTRRKKISSIWSTAGIERLEKYKKNEQKKYKNIIGYTGNLDYTKLHSDFFSACDKIKNNNAEFVVIGPTTKVFLDEYENSKVKTKMEITGFISEDNKFQLMQDFKVFGYPLARHHYGTCDQTIQEANALGIPVVVLNNPMESYMVQHGYNGLIAKNIAEYSSYIELLLTNNSLHSQLSANAIEFANNHYSLKAMVSQWSNEFVNLMNLEKHTRLSFSEKLGKRLVPSELFLESLGNYRGVFDAHRISKNELVRKQTSLQINCLQALPNWSSPSKSTATHYSKFFPDDQLLKEWSDLTLLN